MQLLPLSVVFVGMITLNNLCLKNVGVSFYYIGRCCSSYSSPLSYICTQEPDHSLQCSLNLLHSRPENVAQVKPEERKSLNSNQFSYSSAICCCLSIVGGFYLGVDQEDQSGSFSLTGTIFGVLASLFVSLYSIYTKKVLPVVEGQSQALTTCRIFRGYRTTLS